MQRKAMTISLVIILAMVRGCTAFHPARSMKPIMGPSSSAKRYHTSISSPLIPSVLSMSPSDSNSSDGSNNSSGSSSSDVDQLRQTASKLRAEAQAAEKALGSSRGTADRTEYVKPVEYLDLDDSCWEITYRFANEPISTKEEDEDKEKVQRKIYSGKLQLQFRNDGYTDILPTTSGEADSRSTNTATFRKVWGWDPETSAEDSLDYLLFSADVELPPPISTSERFYFQARVDREGKNKDGIISLNDGSVTVKRNVEAPGGGWWGIFRGAEGILAQFRQVGEFKCRPITKQSNP